MPLGKFASINQKHYSDLNSTVRLFADDALLCETIFCDASSETQGQSVGSGERARRKVSRTSSFART